MEAGRQAGKGRRKALPDVEQLLRGVRPRRQPHPLAELVKEIHEDEIREVEDAPAFSACRSSRHLPVLGLDLLPFPVFGLGLFLGLGQPLPDGGALLPVQGHGGELLEGRLKLVLVLRLEEHIVVRWVGGGVLFQGIVDVILLRHRRKRLDVLLRDLDVGQGGPMLFELVQGLFPLV